jgi:predicted nucleic acid-binding protein
MLKAVVDTNVLISGTIRKSGHPNRIMNAWREAFSSS